MEVWRSLSFIHAVIQPFMFEHAKFIPASRPLHLPLPGMPLLQILPWLTLIFKQVTLKLFPQRSSLCGLAEMNPISMRMQIRSLASFGGLRIQHYHELWYGLGFKLALGVSYEYGQTSHLMTCRWLSATLPTSLSRKIGLIRKCNSVAYVFHTNVELSNI